ncbi:MAG TPA: SpoIVB peptidase S55 domain-containing protein, partial [Propionibacteriaceae bacterium]|nr:SpoIVB peptidase S55 domain-containing protein [Propionibacteriaceae bacterium]
MSAFTFRAAKTTALGSALALALVAGLLTAPASAAPIPDATDCPAILPTSSVTPGMTGQGLTVVRGATPQPFAVEVLGVLENGIGAGRDMIMIEASDLPGRNVISAGGGIWGGMSGSPVYIDGKLLGAVAYGFSPAPSTIGGVTPATDMLDLLDLPTPAAHVLAASTAAQKKVSLSAADRRAIASRAEAAVPAGSLEPLTLPMSVSGLTSNRLKRFQTEAEEADLPVFAFAGSRRTAPTATATLTRPRAGGNFAAALSYGDLTVAGLGTTTAICGDQAVAFGHPYQFIGVSSYGANDANSLTIVKDTTYGSFKLASLGAQVGTVDQDRRAGLRADLTRVPALTPITSTIQATDNGKRRRGTTLAADATSLPLITAFGLLANYDSVFDEIGEGRASTSWTITGRRARNVPFTINRSNKFASQLDISADAALDVADAVNALVTNEFEPVTIDRVSLLSTVTAAYQQWTITTMDVSVNGGPFRSPELLSVRAGATLKARVRMRPYRSSAVKTSYFNLTVPANTSGRTGSLVVTGGADLA